MAQRNQRRGSLFDNGRAASRKGYSATFKSSIWGGNTTELQLIPTLTGSNIYLATKDNIKTAAKQPSFSWSGAAPTDVLHSLIKCGYTLTSIQGKKLNHLYVDMHTVIQFSSESFKNHRQLFWLLLIYLVSVNIVIYNYFPRINLESLLAKHLYSCCSFLASLWHNRWEPTIFLTLYNNLELYPQTALGWEIAP